MYPIKLYVLKAPTKYTFWFIKKQIMEKFKNNQTELKIVENKVQIILSNMLLGIVSNDD